MSRLVKMSSPPASSRVGQRLESLPTPCFVVDLAAVKANCVKMRDRARENSVQLRCHVKTHKTVEGALMQTGGTKR